MPKKLLSFLLALLLLTLPLTLWGCDEGEDGEGDPVDPLAVPEPTLSFTLLEDGTWSVSKGGLVSKKEIIIPAEHEGRPVTQIAAGGFKDAIASKITVPSTVTAIGAAAFKNCNSLTSLVLPAHIREIPAEAFMGCIYLEDFTVPQAVTSIGNSAFEGCTALTSFTVPEGVTALGSRVFYNCPALASISLPGSLSTVGSKAFAIIGEETLLNPHVLQYTTRNGDRFLGNPQNPYLVLIQCGSTEKEYTVPEDTLILYDSAFYALPLESITLHAAVRDIGALCFAYCTSLTAINLPASVGAIGDGAFLRCTALKTASGLSGVVSIGSEAFAYCTALQTITLGSALSFVGTNAFYRTSSLQKNVHEGIRYLGNADNPYLLLYATESKKSEAYTIHPDTKIIYQLAFSGCTAMTELTIPHGVIRICPAAFSGCSELSEVSIPATVTVIEESAFRNCKKLYTVTVPQSVTYLGFGAFSGCSSLVAITLPFVGQTKSGVGNTLFGHIFGADSTDDHGKKIPVTLTAVTVTGGTVIGASAFSNCEHITTVRLPATLKVLGAAAFFHAKSITRVHIEDLAAWCNITMGTEESNPLYHGGALFVDGKQIKELVIPAGVTEIKPYAFFGCTGITSLQMSEDVTTVGDDAFHGCTELTAATVGASVTTLKTSVFEGCEALSELTLPKGLSHIGSSCFRRCKSLEEITLPASLTYIGDRTFKDCEALTRVTFKNIFGWRVTESKSDAKGERTFPILPKSAATLLTEDFVNLYWKRK